MQVVQAKLEWGAGPTFSKIITKQTTATIRYITELIQLSIGLTYIYIFNPQSPGAFQEILITAEHIRYLYVCLHLRILTMSVKLNQNQLPWQPVI